MIEILIICSLINVDPYYDCSQEWEIHIYWDNFHMTEICGESSNGIPLGCAKYNKHPIMDKINTPKIYIANVIHYDEWGQSVLEHEIRHLKCRCTWEGHK